MLDPARLNSGSINVTEAVYYLLAVLLILAALGCWLANVLTLPGNWVIPLLAGGFAWAYPAQPGAVVAAKTLGISWMVVWVLLGLAVLGELLELAAGMAGAARQGASRRAMALSLVGSFVGSMVGAILLSGVFPLVGTLVGAVAGGAGGAFGGAYLGEWWKGRNSPDRLAVGRGALLGRVLGTLSKLLVGATMVTVLAISAFFE